MPEVTENYIRIPVNGGSGAHKGHKIRTITINESKGIKALYCVDCKLIVTYLFDVDQWTMSEAEDWIEENEGESKSDDQSESCECRQCTEERMMRIKRKDRDTISSTVRFKSYGAFIAKAAGVADGDILVKGFFTDDQQDSVGDVIRKEGTQRAVDKWRRWGNIRTMHDYPSGRVEKIGEEDGLAWNEIETVPVDENTRKLIEGGVLKGYSVGIIPRVYELNEAALSDDDPWWYMPLIIHDYDLVEISYVDHPANYSAGITQVAMKEYGIDQNRVVIYKGSEVMEDLTTEQDAEFEKLEDEDEVFEEWEELSEKLDDDVPESTPDDGDPILLAVQEVMDKVNQLETFVLNDLVPAIVNGMSELLNEQNPDDMEDEDADADTDEVDAKHTDISGDGSSEHSAGIDIEKLADEVSERVLGIIASVLPAKNSRKGAVGPGDDEEEEEAVDSVTKTRQLMELSKDERRKLLKEALLKAHNK